MPKYLTEAEVKEFKKQFFRGLSAGTAAWAREQMARRAKGRDGRESLSKEKRNEVLRLFHKGEMSARELAKRFGFSEHGIYKFLHRHVKDLKEIFRQRRISIPQKGLIREKQRKLSPDQVREIRRRREAGLPIISLAREYGVNPGTVFKVANGLTYRDVT